MKKHYFKNTQWYVYYDRSLEGNLKWVICHDNLRKLDAFYETGEDQLWNTKGEAFEMIEAFILEEDSKGIRDKVKQARLERLVSDKKRYTDLIEHLLDRNNGFGDARLIELLQAKVDNLASGIKNLERELNPNEPLILSDRMVVIDLEGDMANQFNDEQEGYWDDFYDEPNDYSHSEQCHADRSDYANELEKEGKICPIQAAEMRAGA